MTERRRFLRFETALNAICEIVSEKCRSSYKVKNISKDGALLMLDRPLKEGDAINVTMDVPGDNVPVFASCEVALQKDSDRSSGIPSYETGVKFVTIDSAHKGRLLEYIYSQWLRLIDR